MMANVRRFWISSEMFTKVVNDNRESGGNKFWILPVELHYVRAKYLWSLPWHQNCNAAANLVFPDWMN
jgi:hypothetical protein